MRAKPNAEKDEMYSIHAVQIHKTPISDQAIMDEHYDTAQQDASLPEYHLTETVQFNEELNKNKNHCP